MDHALCERRVLNVEDEERTYYRERPSGAAKDESAVWNRGRLRGNAVLGILCQLSRIVVALTMHDDLASELCILVFAPEYGLRVAIKNDCWCLYRMICDERTQEAHARYSRRVV